jgi:hypothetical protein
MLFCLFADTYICMGELFLFRFCCRYVHICLIYIWFVIPDLLISQLQV